MTQKQSPQRKPLERRGKRSLEIKWEPWLGDSAGGNTVLYTRKVPVPFSVGVYKRQRIDVSHIDVSLSPSSFSKIQ